MSSGKLKHNKKRNVGLLSEFFSKEISKHIIEKKYDNIDKVKGIWVKYFKEGTEINKESRLFHVLYETRVKNKEAAISLLETVKRHCQNQDIEKLEQEKTALIKEINATLGKKTFFNKEVQDYRNLATIQILLNSWRDQQQSNDSIYCIQEVATLEDKMIDNLISTPASLNESVEAHKEEISPDSVLSMQDKDIDSLVVSIMSEKFNKKYENILSEEQKNIINLYTFSDLQSGSQKEDLIAYLKEQRMQTLSFVQYEINNTTSSSTKKKLAEVKELLETKYGDFSSIDDEMIMFYTHLCKLKEELRSS